MTVGKPDGTYILHEEPNGTIILEPAVVMSEEEYRFMSNAKIQADIAHAKAHPEERVPFRKRR